MKKAIFLLSLLLLTQNFFGQAPQSFDLSSYGVQIEPDRRLIIVMASLDAGGIEIPLTERGEAFRTQMRADLQNLNPELREKIKTFLAQYKKHAAEEYKRGLSDSERTKFSENDKDFLVRLTAPFVSLAYALTPAPELADPFRSTDLPGELLEVLDYAPLVREFYRRSGINGKLDEYVKTYQETGDKMRPSANNLVREILDYLHTRPELTYSERVKTQAKDAKGRNTIERVEIREHARRFYLIPDLLGAANTPRFRNIGDDYYVVVPPQVFPNQPFGSEVRSAYLQFVLDPLVLKNAKDISTLAPAIRAMLEDMRKHNPQISGDVYLAVLRSVTAAVNAREIEYQRIQAATRDARERIEKVQGVEAKKAVSAQLDADKKSFADETALEMAEAYERGAVFSFYFADQLKGLEDSGFDIASSLHDMILSLDPAKEGNRLTQAADARRRGLIVREERRKKAEARNIELSVKESATAKGLNEIEPAIAAKNFVDADARLKKLLADNANDPRIFYSLGRVAALAAADAKGNLAEQNKHLEDARTYYSNVIRAATADTDPALLSLSYVALGRIYEYFDNTDYAVKIYQKAMTYGDVAGGGYAEAKGSFERLTKK
jgi:hypothetical protein